MNEKDLFGLALGLVSPWYIDKIEFDAANKRLDLFLDFKRGSRFPCPECGESSPIHDTTERTWRHLDFFQHKAYLTARVPRTNCPKCGVKQVTVSWARPGSGFTLLFEALVLHMAREMPVTSVAELASVNQMSVWRILERYVEKAVETADLSDIKAVGIDECSKQKGHKYITTFCDLDKSRVVYVAEGRGSNTLDAFAGHLEDKGLDTGQVKEVCCDMWPAYLSGIEENLPEAAVTFDRYHVMAKMNKAVDEVRRREAKEELLLKETRYLWLKNPENLTRKQRLKLNSVKEQDLKTARAYHIKLALRRFWEFKYTAAASRYLKKWYFWATHSRLEPMVEVAKLIKRHEEGILRFLKSRITNGVVEGLNSKIKTALKRAYGFKSFNYYRIIIYLVAGKLNLPTQC
ncbi:MAG: ISL3 family transposase [Thermodesulfobacteriota bacterium]